MEDGAARPPTLAAKSSSYLRPTYLRATLAASECVFKDMRDMFLKKDLPAWRTLADDFTEVPLYCVHLLILPPEPLYAYIHTYIHINIYIYIDISIYIY